MKSFLPKDPGEDRTWVVIDAEGRPLGRLAVTIANMLRGKHRPTFSRQVDTGDFVVVINAEKVKLTGNKEQQKLYHRYSGYRGGLKSVTAAAVRARHPERLIEGAVKGMLPRNNLSRKMYRRLKVYTGGEHPHEAQHPEVVESL